MKVILVYLSLVLLFICISLSDGKKRYPEPKTKIQPKPKPVKLNTDNLPTLQEILESLNLSRFFKDFIKMGVTETRLLVRLSSMDFRMMQMDFDNISDEEIMRLKDEVASLIIKATVVEEVIRPELAERGKLTYGRVYMEDSVQSFEFMLASFGGPPPIGRFKLDIPDSPYGCEANEGTNYEGNVVLIKRGECTFLAKAKIAKDANASALLVVNNVDRLESPASGLGVDKNITDAMVLSLGNFPVLSLANTTWSKLEYAVNVNRQLGVSTYVDMVPLKCRTGGVCAPLLSEEKDVQDEVSWGTIRLRSHNTATATATATAAVSVDTATASSSGGGGSAGATKEVRSFEFLSSIYGSQLPTRLQLEVVLAENIEGCEPYGAASEETAVAAEVAVDGSTTEEAAAGGNSTKENGFQSMLQVLDLPRYKGKAVVVHRGGCRFDIKTLHAQNAGASFVIVVDVEDNALQRMGGLQPEAGYIGIPSVLVTAPAGRYIHSQISGSGGGALTVEVMPARDKAGSEAWIELAFTEWQEEEEQLVLQLEGLIKKHEQAQQHVTSSGASKDATSTGEIVAWLHRKLDSILNSKKKSIATDHL
jgi:hypothetical protein